MAHGLTREEVERIAALAHLEFERSDLDVFTRQLAGILAYVDEVLQVDVTEVPPTTHVVTQHVSERADRVQPSLNPRDALANAPDPAPAAGLFKVPRVIG